MDIPCNADKVLSPWHLMCKMCDFLEEVTHYVSHCNKLRVFSLTSVLVQQKCHFGFFTSHALSTRYLETPKTF